MKNKGKRRQIKASPDEVRDALENRGTKWEDVKQLTQDEKDGGENGE